MTPPRTSVVIVSRGRAAHLRRCLLALRLQHHPDFEIVLVADAAGLPECPELDIKRIAFDEPNISAARNLGIGAAAGGVIAFIDDDSIAEPCWLFRLTAPFCDPQVIAATGWTRNRDGFSWQARSHLIGPDGLTRTFPSAPGISLHPPCDGAAVSTLGTNCAFRADAVRAIGGFDPAFAYHLDESDVNLRLAAAFPHGLTAIVPDAQVIHEQAASAHRSAALAARDLTAKGRSTAIFARRHGADIPTERLVSRHRRQLLRQMLDGRLDPFKVAPILKTLRRGIAEGRDAEATDPPSPRQDAPPDFRALAPAADDPLTLTGWHWQATALRRRAARDTAAGRIVTLILLSPSFLPHRVTLTEGGWFEQMGGLWGASEPDDPPVRAWTMTRRSRRERDLAEARRNLSLYAGVCAARLWTARRSK
ncbi:Glycosyltransferase, GT2 family [Paracoccus isoporae]|uniref:Glycosyltransferase, GT2 family n=1 Tax=Paracoccus isoporae TaxID=591205 RepID=A0A1G6Z4V6_9RHOB|nr:glycosyltransferase [Paracoccus isoporae]SDD97680.1 Glycosyltransferase, GT2 family [Paracoccus isoporae]